MGKEKMKQVTLSDVAREAGVSRSAVARVLLGTGGEHVRVSKPTRMRIEEASARLDYSPNSFAQQLRGKASGIIGVILDTVNTPVMSRRLFALEKEANQRGYRLLVGHAHGDEATLKEYARDFRGRAAECILCLFDLAPGRDGRARASFGTFRKLVFHGRPAWPDGYCVRVETETAIREAVDHVIGRGKKRLALSVWNCESDELVALRRDVFVDYTKSRRVKGFVWDAATQGSEPTPRVLDDGIEYLVRQCGADAILASNDIWATRFILQLQKGGLRVPEDVAVIGYDDLDIASVVSPTLTTIDQAHDDYARAAMELLLDLAAGRRIPRNRRTRAIKPRLIVREST